MIVGEFTSAEKRYELKFGSRTLRRLEEDFDGVSFFLLAQRPQGIRDVFLFLRRGLEEDWPTITDEEVDEVIDGFDGTPMELTLIVQKAYKAIALGTTDEEEQKKTEAHLEKVLAAAGLLGTGGSSSELASELSDSSETRSID